MLPRVDVGRSEFGRDVFSRGGKPGPSFTIRGDRKSIGPGERPRARDRCR